MRTKEQIAAEETKVPCPVCRTGLVPPAVARKVEDLLKADAERSGPLPSDPAPSPAPRRKPEG